MSFLKRLFGWKPDRRSAKQIGFFWQSNEMPALAAGRGWNQAVVGESFYRATLKHITGGSTIYGVTVDKPGELVVDVFEGAPCLTVVIEGRRVGSIARQESGNLLAELQALAPAGRASVKANVSAGYEGADYCVRLSLARPLRIRKN